MTVKQIEEYYQAQLRQEQAKNKIMRHELISALTAIAGWASDKGPLNGKGPMDVSDFARKTVAEFEGMKNSEENVEGGKVYDEVFYGG